MPTGRSGERREECGSFECESGRPGLKSNVCHVCLTRTYALEPKEELFFLYVVRARQTWQTIAWRAIPPTVVTKGVYGPRDIGTHGASSDIVVWLVACNQLTYRFAMLPPFLSLLAEQLV
jgi:hypothetical protein